MASLENPLLSKQIDLLDQILAASTDHIYVYDRAGQHLYASPAGLAALGLEAREVLGKSWRELNFPAEVMERHDRQRESVFQTGIPVKGETLFPTPQGLRYYEYVISPVLGAAGKIEAVINTGRDMTERQQAENALRQLTEELETRVLARTAELTALNESLQVEIAERQKAEQALQESEMRFHALVDAMFEGIVVQENGKIIEANPGFANMFGYSLDEVIGKSAVDFLTPESLETVMGNMQNEYELPYEMTGIKKDGTLINLEVVGKQSLYQGRRVRVSAARDITERKRAEIALREKEQQLQQLSDSMPQFVWISNAQGETEYVNRQWLEYSGLTPEQSCDLQKVAEFHHPEEVQAVLEQWTIARATQQPFEMEARLKRASDGAYRWFLIRSVPALDQQGQVVRWYGTSTDIHDRKVAQLNEQFLSDLDCRLRQLTDSQAMEWEVVSSLGEYLQVDRCLWHTVDLEAGVTTVGQDWYRQLDLKSTAGVYQLSEYILPEMIHHYRTGQPLVIEDVTTHVYTASVAHNFAQHKIRAILGIPWIESGRWVAALAVNSCTTRTWRSDEVRLLQEIVARLWSLIEQKRAVKVLQEQEERTRLATEAADLGMWFWNLTQNELVWTERCKALFGLPADVQISYEVFLQTLHPDDRDFTHAAVTQALEQRTEYDIEYRTVWPDGSIHWIAAKGRGFYDADRQPIRMMGTVQDISDRKQVEAELRKKEELYRALAHNFPNGAVHIFDHDLRYLLSDGTEMSKVGLSQEQLEGHLLWEVVPSETSAVLEPLYRAALSGETTISELAFAGGIYQIYTLPLRDQQGEIFAGLSMSQNVTMLKQAEQTLRTARDELERQVQERTRELQEANALLQQREREFRTLVENTPDVITRHDRQYRCLYINPASTQSLGMPPEFFIGKTPSELGYPDDLAHFWENSLENVFTTGQMQIDEFNVTNGDEIQSYQVCVVPELELVPEQENDRSIISVMTIGRDVTRLKQAEEAAQKLAEELKRSNQELEQFAYVASHDLQEPLRAITSFTQLLAKRYRGQLDVKAETYMEFIVDGATRMQQLIKDLLTYSRAGRYELKLQPVDCQKLLDQVKKDLQVVITETQATFTADPLPTIIADPTQFKNLLQNLISNSLKYRSEIPPKIHVSARKVFLRSENDFIAAPSSLSLPGPHEKWLFSVQDNGIGIEPQYAERIFGIFQRLHTSDEYSGTGLGLAICRKIVERHHGRIWVESQLGQGATFFFTIPISMRSQDDIPPPITQDSPGGRF